MAEELARKRRQRAGHRSSAKRIISSVIDVLGGGDISQVREHEIKLKQQRDSLQQKLNTLRQLDAEILDLVAEEEIEGEIERADLLEENVQLAIANIENALSPKVVCFNVNTEANVSESTSANEVQIGSNSSPPSASTSNSSSSVRRNTQVKLPKLELKKFDGDHSKWISFWDSFEASVHKNESLTAIDKFNYLNSLLERSAAEAISGLSLGASNYEEAVDILKARFGNKQQIINRHMEILLNLESVTSHYHVRSLRQLHDTVESNVRSLKSLGVSRESYGGLLSSILMNKLPQEFHLVITREMGDNDWQLDQLLNIFKRELEASERAGGSTVNKGQPSPPKPKRWEEGTTHTMLTSGEANCPTCTYCRGKHPSRDCQTVPDVLACKELL